jgi:hypothetical protein
MFAIPQLMAVPALTSVGVMSMDWPTLGAFLAWTLIAAFVGTGLGALRRLGAQPPPASRARVEQLRVVKASAHAPADHSHLEAA